MSLYNITFNIIHKGVKHLNEWLNSISKPLEYQRRILQEYLDYHSRTEYYKSHVKGRIRGYEDFKMQLPIVKYGSIARLIEEDIVKDRRLIIPDRIIVVGVTSGSTGIPKIIPLTQRDINVRVEVMLAGIANLHRICGSSIIGKVLVGKMPICIYEKFRYKFCHISGLLELLFKHIVKGEDIKKLIGELEVEKVPKGRSEYYRLFEETYQASKNEDVKLIIGSAPYLVFFAWYLKRKHNVTPKEIWDIRVILATGVAYIHEHYKNLLLKLYGEQAEIVELYGATEALMAMQVDRKPYITPLYSKVFLEVKVGNRVKMLHEMEEGEIGRIIVTTPTLIRYDIGDIVECIEKGKYYKIHGRARRTTMIRLRVERGIKHIAEKIQMYL